MKALLLLFLVAAVKAVAARQQAQNYSAGAYSEGEEQRERLVMIVLGSLMLALCSPVVGLDLLYKSRCALEHYKLSLFLLNVVMVFVNLGFFITLVLLFYPMVAAPLAYCAFFLYFSHVLKQDMNLDFSDVLKRNTTRFLFFLLELLNKPDAASKANEPYVALPVDAKTDQPAKTVSLV
mmetsp:Transcript_25067/g.77368  ORF Transcript_25067/g.77368 Transcript_25067/m.77368 type:complete len:179 (+) Transcript_25067:19-555(+)